MQKLGEAAGGGQTREPGFLCASDEEQGRLPLLGMLGSGGEHSPVQGRAGKTEPAPEPFLDCTRAVALGAERELGIRR